MNEINKKPFAALRELILSKYQTFDKFAQAMDLSKTSLSYKLNGKTQWRHKDIIKACALLDINDCDISHYFLRLM